MYVIVYNIVKRYNIVKCSYIDSSNRSQSLREVFLKKHHRGLSRQQRRGAHQLVSITSLLATIDGNYTADRYLLTLVQGSVSV